MTLTIRAIDTIAVESGYEMIYDGRGKNTEAVCEDAEEDEFGPEDNTKLELELPTAEDYGEPEEPEAPVFELPIEDEEENDDNGDDDIESEVKKEDVSPAPMDSTRTVSIKPSSPRITVSKSQKPAEKKREATQDYINTKLAAKKNSDAKKALGIVAGVVAVAGGIYALFKKDKK